MEAREHFSSLGARFLLGSIINYVTQLGAVGIVSLVAPQLLASADAQLLLSVLPLYLIGMPTLIFLVKQLPAQTPERHPMKLGQILPYLLMSFALMYLTNILGNIVTTVIGLIKGGAVQNAMVDVATSVSPAVAFSYMVLCAPVMEEFVFRKLIVDRTVRYGEGTAILMSGLMFGLFHGNLNQFAYAFAMGMFFAYLYLKTGNLKITIGMHMVINFVGGIVSAAVLRMIDWKRLTEIQKAGMPMDVFAEYLTENMAGWIVYLFYLLCIIALVISGGVLFIVYLSSKKFGLEKGQAVIPKGSRFRTLICNPGMGAFCLFWTVMIIVQLFA